MRHDSATGRLTIEVTEEMIGVAKRELLRFDPDFTTPREAAERLLFAALAAGDLSAEVRLQDCGASKCQDSASASQSPDKDFDNLMRSALKTPPISNEEIERRSKEQRGATKRRP